jgi:hypothetical protein
MASMSWPQAAEYIMIKTKTKQTAWQLGEIYHGTTLPDEYPDTNNLLASKGSFGGRLYCGR